MESEASWMMQDYMDLIDRPLPNSPLCSTLGCSHPVLISANTPDSVTLNQLTLVIPYGLSYDDKIAKFVFGSSPGCVNMLAFFEIMSVKT